MRKSRHEPQWMLWLNIQEKWLTGILFSRLEPEQEHGLSDSRHSWKFVSDDVSSIQLSIEFRWPNRELSNVEVSQEHNPTDPENLKARSEHLTSLPDNVSISVNRKPEHFHINWMEETTVKTELYRLKLSHFLRLFLVIQD